KVIIIGAGFSGLAAAWHLSQKKIDFTVLEARNRIGGRVFSYNMDKKENLIVELGGEWVGNLHKSIRQLCKDFGLELFDNHLDTRLILEGKYFDKGEWNYSEAWQKKIKKLEEDCKHFTDKQMRQQDNMDWWRYLVNEGCDGRDLVIRE